ncbi:MAG TPA: ester cyclase [Chitinophagaceae bacterium]|nr:ester cyclase [Chitinophagaceae bacterium]
MRKIFAFLAAGVLFFCLSCNSKDSGGMSAKAKKNLEAAQAINKMFETGDWSKIGDYIASDAVDHAGMSGDVKGLDSIKAELAHYNDMMTDMKNETVKELADDDYVFQWQKESSTMKVDAMGMKAGSRNSFDAIEVSKFNSDGKVTEHWSFVNYTDMMKMMPQQGSMGNKMDTTKHN